MNLRQLLKRCGLYCLALSHSAGRSLALLASLHKERDNFSLECLKTALGGATSTSTTTKKRLGGDSLPLQLGRCNQVGRLDDSANIVSICGSGCCVTSVLNFADKTRAEMAREI